MLFRSLDERVRRIDELNRANLGTGGVVIACGIARYENDRSVAAVFERADSNMYANKKKLKA